MILKSLFHLCDTHSIGEQISIRLLIMETFPANIVAVPAQHLAKYFLHNIIQIFSFCSMAGQQLIKIVSQSYNQHVCCSISDQRVHKSELLSEYDS